MRDQCEVAAPVQDAGCARTLEPAQTLRIRAPAWACCTIHPRSFRLLLSRRVVDCGDDHEVRLARRAAGDPPRRMATRVTLLSATASAR